MSTGPNPALVRRVQALILEMFDVSQQEAEVQAAGMVSLAEGWGTPETAEQLDWTSLVQLQLGQAKRFKWRSDADRATFEANQKLMNESVESFLRNRHGKRL